MRVLDKEIPGATYNFSIFIFIFTLNHFLHVAKTQHWVRSILVRLLMVVTIPVYSELYISRLQHTSTVGHPSTVGIPMILLVQHLYENMRCCCYSYCRCPGSSSSPSQYTANYTWAGCNTHQPWVYPWTALSHCHFFFSSSIQHLYENTRCCCYSYCRCPGSSSSFLHTIHWIQQIYCQVLSRIHSSTKHFLFVFVSAQYSMYTQCSSLFWSVCDDTPQHIINILNHCNCKYKRKHTIYLF